MSQDEIRAIFFTTSVRKRQTLIVAATGRAAKVYYHSYREGPAPA
jgi:hypothetical protein